MLTAQGNAVMSFRVIFQLAAGMALLGSVGHSVVAYSFLGHRWPPGAIPISLQLGEAARLLDGSSDWNDCARAGLDAWNAVLGSTGVWFSPVLNSPHAPAEDDGHSHVFFSNDIFGTPFGAQVLAVTSSFFNIQDGVDEATESDIIFNNAKRFNCYRGSRRLGPEPERRKVNDLRRVATHEFGHALGLDHPDDDGQKITALMNGVISDIDDLQPDDIRGVLTLYGISITGIKFPPRDEQLLFFLRLKDEYRDTLGRTQNNPSFVDTEGSAVWYPEFLRYTVSGCSPTEATDRVFLQIQGQGIQPECGETPGNVVEFPPRDVSLNFLRDLSEFYRTTLGRGLNFGFVDLEGKAVWQGEYLRYRVNGCNHQAAVSNVLSQIRGGGIPPVCTTADNETATQNGAQERG